MSNGIIDGNVKGMFLLSLVVDPASVATITTAEQTFTLTGVKVGDMVFANKPTNTVGLGIVNTRVTAADTIGITFVNPTVAGVDAASETWNFLVFRPEGSVAKTNISA